METWLRMLWVTLSITHPKKTFYFDSTGISLWLQASEYKHTEIMSKYLHVEKSNV